MAVPNISVPSFSITNDEKAENVNYINSLLHRCGSLLESYGKKLSAFDLRDALIAVQDALFMATDPGACESPPLAKCYLYQGHVLGVMKKHLEARDAYQKAARISSSNCIERAASELAAGLAVQMEDEFQDRKREGDIWSEIIRNDALRIIPVQPYYEYNKSQLENVDPQHNSLSIQEVSLRRGAWVEKPRLQSLPEPQRLIQCDEGWIAETVSTPAEGPEDKFCEGVLCLVSDIHS
ncbi:hypothetical protein F5Y13DRAFT_197414 [Hypoxylon sp. FL1857]|nr:hypothetical protein F5Y13DRAFT_197414 [Hypoxylon sp. FL1857]